MPGEDQRSAELHQEMISGVTEFPKIQIPSCEAGVKISIAVFGQNTSSISKRPQLRPILMELRLLIIFY